MILAVASNALILGFNVDADERAKEISAKEGIDIKTYSIIYELANDIKAAVEGMLEPKLKKVALGKVEIRKVLKLAVKLGGESFSDYRKPDGSKGDFDTERKAYKREGQKCARCGTKIKRTKFGGRSAFFCPHCQTLDK